jgi:signal transduction histidine kinase
MLSLEHSEGAPGLESFYEIRLVPLLRNQVIAIGRNITKRKIAEAKLEDMHKLLTDASRQAGMAEIANNVLHNIGNVLNSVNVSAGLIGDTVRDSKAQGLAKVVQLMNDHAAALGEFLTRDERGKVLPGYLNRLVVALAAEKQSIAEELNSLTKNIDHIKDIVATQQSYSGATSVIESVQIKDLMEDALRMNASSMARHQITIVREFADMPALRLDKHLVLQILVNLIRNAKYAMDCVPDVAHRITLRTEIAARADGHCLRIVVKDDGEGIAADKLVRLFAHGYTTRKNGHGFGLHSCALAAKEMAGTITASSDGLGKGATFTLELPAHPAAEPQ